MMNTYTPLPGPDDWDEEEDVLSLEALQDDEYDEYGDYGNDDDEEDEPDDASFSFEGADEDIESLLADEDLIVDDVDDEDDTIYDEGYDDDDDDFDFDDDESYDLYGDD